MKLFGRGEIDTLRTGLVQWLDLLFQLEPTVAPPPLTISSQPDTLWTASRGVVKKKAMMDMHHSSNFCTDFHHCGLRAQLNLAEGGRRNVCQRWHFWSLSLYVFHQLACSQVVFPSLSLLSTAPTPTSTSPTPSRHCARSTSRGELSHKWLINLQ